jgi:hypothetical protein
MSDIPTRREVAFSVDIQDVGKRFVQVIDRISVDDIFVHMGQMEVFKVMTGYDAGDDVSANFIEFVVSDNLITR